MRPVEVGTSEVLTDRHEQVFVDVHCHCLAGMDDGPADASEAIQLCEALVRDGIRTVVATPHQLGRFDRKYNAQQIRDAVEQLNGILDNAHIPLTVLPGADVRLDERIPDLLRSDQILTIADLRQFLLLEIPHEVFIDPHALLAELHAAGMQAVITHPERHDFLATSPSYVHRWVKYGCYLQITAASFLGEFGLLSEKAAFAFLQGPLPVLVATDAHGARSRAPRMSAAYDVLRQRCGRRTADTVCIQNPARLLGREPLVPLCNVPLRQTKG